MGGFEKKPIPFFLSYVLPYQVSNFSGFTTCIAVGGVESDDYELRWGSVPISHGCSTQLRMSGRGDPLSHALDNRASQIK